MCLPLEKLHPCGALRCNRASRQEDGWSSGGGRGPALNSYVLCFALCGVYVGCLVAGLRACEVREVREDLRCGSLLWPTATLVDWSGRSPSMQIQEAHGGDTMQLALAVLREVLVSQVP